MTKLGIEMVRRDTVSAWWRRNRDRARQFCSDFSDIRQHEGFTTASRVLGFRLWRFAKYRLLTPQPVRNVAPASPVSAANRDCGALAAAPQKSGALFVGYVEASLGLGESLRGLIHSAAEAGVPFGIYPFNVNVESRIIGPFRQADYDLDGHYEITVIETATDQLPLVLQTLGIWRTKRSYTILRRRRNGLRCWSPSMRSGPPTALSRMHSGRFSTGRSRSFRPASRSKRLRRQAGRSSACATRSTTSCSLSIISRSLPARTRSVWCAPSRLPLPMPETLSG
jgi:hypothetical protein